MKPFSYKLGPLGFTERHLWSQYLKNIPGPGCLGRPGALRPLLARRRIVRNIWTHVKQLWC